MTESEWLPIELPNRRVAAGRWLNDHVFRIVAIAAGTGPKESEEFSVMGGYANFAFGVARVLEDGAGNADGLMEFDGSANGCRQLAADLEAAALWLERRGD